MPGYLRSETARGALKCCAVEGCGSRLPRRHTKYCARHSPQASLLWKRALRRSCRGSRYWLDRWLTLTGDEQAARQAYNAYMRRYMRSYRRRRRKRHGIRANRARRESR